MYGPSDGGFRKHALPVITKCIHGSAPFLTTFLLIHLSAPLLANLGGSSLASQTLLLGREYYQTELGEKYLLLGPIVLHTVSGLAKRLISPSKVPPRPWTSLLSITGYGTMLFFLPIHFSTHRVSPSNPIAPIHALSPSELDFEYIKFGLNSWPWRSAFLYGGLVVFALLHAADGERILFNTYLGPALGRIKASTRKGMIAAVMGAVALPVLTGLYFLSQEPEMIFASMADRFHASFVSSMWYRL
ncbi:unnamed protein product [Mycena citricolor]|uniref:Mitochondrial adapter protein MCP1 transmembrane domain-containing protein n=1 Tax=Mycena citricolor TaxID=2018698 RepID=A0AAD2H603_9AGAR|nr:unnamed protein product [Mycena citricolor]